MHFSDTSVALIEMSFMLIPGQRAQEFAILTGYKMCLVHLESSNTRRQTIKCN